MPVIFWHFVLQSLITTVNLIKYIFYFRLFLFISRIWIWFLNVLMPIVFQASLYHFLCSAKPMQRFTVTLQNLKLYLFSIPFPSLVHKCQPLHSCRTLVSAFPLSQVALLCSSLYSCVAVWKLPPGRKSPWSLACFSCPRDHKIQYIKRSCFS